jgi:predicted MFS family arabinose efflux permease
MAKSEWQNPCSDVGLAWEPLRQPFFRTLWVATLVSNIGTWMQNTAAAWLMTSLTSSTIMVALVQTATTIPVFVLALPAGVLADILDRRRLLLATQIWMLLAATALGALTLAGHTTPWLLLALTLMLGLGAAMNAPAWQSIVPELVPRPQLAAAISLNSAGFNAARAIGPALGGLVVASLGAAGAFLLNAASFLAVVAVLYRWHQPVPDQVEAVEQLGAALRNGIAYVRHTPTLHVVIVRAVTFVVCGIALLALLPVVVRQHLQLGAVAYGWALASFGIGAVLGVTFRPYLRHLMGMDLMTAIATVWFAVVLFLLAHQRHFAVDCVLLVSAGVAWLVLLASFNTTVQTTTPSRVRGRVLAVYLLFFFGGMAGGSVVWGAVAAVVGVSAALQAAAGGLLLGLIATYRLRLDGDLDLECGIRLPGRDVDQGGHIG